MRASFVRIVRRMALTTPVLMAASLVVLGSREASAQIPNASAAAYGMGGNFTAIARGYEAVAWNPANLAMPRRPWFSLGIGIGGGTVGLTPIDFRTMHEFSGQIVDSATRAGWLEQVRASGGEQLRLDAGITPLAFSVGPFAIQTGAVAYSSMNLSPDAYEALVLFGNAGNNNGNAKALDLTGTSIRGGLLSSVAASFAIPIPINLSQGIIPNERAAIGITGKYVMGHGVLIAQDNGSVLGTGDEMTIDFPMILPDSNYDGLAGTGIGVDVGVSWSGGPWRVGLLAENLMNTFAWDTSKLAAVSGTGTISIEENTTNFDQVPFSAAPQFLRDLVTNQRFKPAFTLGAAMDLTSALTITADLRQAVGGDDAISVGPESRMGVGAEFRLLPFLPLRAGVASVTDGWQAGAGIGLRLLGYELGLSTAIRRRGEASESGVMIGVVGIGR